MAFPVEIILRGFDGCGSRSQTTPTSSDMRCRFRRHRQDFSPDKSLDSGIPRILSAGLRRLRYRHGKLFGELRTLRPQSFTWWFKLSPENVVVRVLRRSAACLACLLAQPPAETFRLLNCCEIFLSGGGLSVWARSRCARTPERFLTRCPETIVGRDRSSWNRSLANCGLVAGAASVTSSRATEVGPG